MVCEERFITIKPIWHSYLVLSLDNCAHKIFTETDLKHFFKKKETGLKLLAVHW